MSTIQQPDFIPMPWASSGSRDTIPTTQSQTGRASWSKGFPEETARPLGAGGIPPNYLDFQGVLYALSHHAVFEQCGGRYLWDDDNNYPAGACILGSNGVVYQALQDSGPDTSAGAKDPTVAANSSYWGPLATPDGTTIKLTSGKLAVDLNNVASSLADGSTITANNGKLTATGSGASGLADGETIINVNDKLRVNYGPGLSYDSTLQKLVVDFQDLTVEQVLALCDRGGGIDVNQNEYLQKGDKWVDQNGVQHTVTAAQAAQTPNGYPNPNYGKLIVDFSRIDEDTKAAILSGLSMQVPLSGNKTFYVDAASDGDTIVEGRGTSDLPFKTIQGCVNYVTQTYALGKYHITIRIVAGTYNENVSLPDFDVGTGYISITTDSGQRDVKVVAQQKSNGMVGTAFSASGGKWHLSRMDVYRTEHATTATGQVGSCYYASGTAVLDLYGCAAHQSMPEGLTPGTEDPLGGNIYEVRIFQADSGGTIRFFHGQLPGIIETEQPMYNGSSTNPYINVIDIARGGSVWLIKEYDSDNDPVTTDEIQCSGSCHRFLNMWQVGSVNTFSSGTIIHFVDADPDNPMTGKRYNLAGGSHVSGNLGATFFPGNVAGTVDTSTYCWYA